MKKDFYLIRTYSAGIHCGYISFEDGKTVILNNARRIWRWKDANTLNELSLYGCEEVYSRISEPVKEIKLTEVIEIILCTDKAEENLTRSRWGN